jgi:molecular chaperone HtpG
VFLTKKPGEKNRLISSRAMGSRTTPSKKPRKTGNGTIITIYFKKNADDEDYDQYLESYTIENLVKKYSDYIRYPIKMDVTTSKPKLDKDGKPIEGKYDDVIENKTLNSMVPALEEEPQRGHPRDAQ